MLNDTAKPVITTTSAGYRIDCAKECPCGVPVIPVPDQWLEVMVTGGFKVWHIIFIIIAFLVTIVVVYCCFHRCRIPRTKQEIEADLMRSNMTNKFSEYLQEFPNEPTTFLEALKRVQDLEEKSEQDDMGARKRKGWLKRMGKERGEKGGEPAKEETTVPDTDPVPAAATAIGTLGPTDETPAVPVDANLATEVKEIATKPDQLEATIDEKSQVGGESDQPKSKTTSKKALKSKASGKTEKLPKREGSQEVVDKSIKTKSEKLITTPAAAHDDSDKSRIEATGIGVSNSANRPARARRKRDKPNLSRAKATHGGSRGESIEGATNNVLTIPVASHHQHHHHHHSTSHHESSSQLPTSSGNHQAPTTTSQVRKVRTKTKEQIDSTVIQIDLSPIKSKSKKDKK